MSKQFFDKMIASSEPGNDALDLAQFWSHRADDAAFQFGLSHTEYTIQLILIYAGDVNNGGHHQFFFNRGMRYFQDHITALRTAGCPINADLLLSLEPIGTCIAKGLDVSNTARALLEDADQEFWRSENELPTNLHAYPQQNSDDVLRAERGLPALAPHPSTA